MVCAKYSTFNLLIGSISSFETDLSLPGLTRQSFKADYWVVVRQMLTNRGSTDAHQPWFDRCSPTVVRQAHQPPDDDMFFVKKSTF